MASYRKPCRDFCWLLRGEVLILRDTWYWYLIQASFVPVSFLLFLWLLTGRQNPDAMPFYVVGALVTGLSFGGLLSLGQQLGGLKEANAFEYYAALPISKVAFIAAIATRGMLLTLPSAIVILAIGHYAFTVPITPPMLAIMVLSSYSLAGFGAIIGFLSPTAQIASLTTQILQTIITMFGPVYITLSSLPQTLQWIAHLWPTTYAAQALQAAINGDPISAYAMPLAALASFFILSIVVIPLHISWRSR